MTTATATWPGPFAAEARSLYQRARESGLSAGRALVLGVIGSFKQGWLFRSSIARHTGLSVRTVQRAITQGRAEGLIGVARAKPNEIPPGSERALPCGWSHRWVIGWGRAAEEVQKAVSAAKARWIVKLAMQAQKPPPPKPDAPMDPPRRPSGRPTRPEYQRRRWTAEELDAELDRQRERKPPDP